MRATAFLAALAALVSGSTAASADGGVDLGHGKRALEPITFENLTLMPIVIDAKAAARARSYMVLDEGMKQKKVIIHEKDDGEVNELVLENTSDQPLFLMAGEVIIGGKQDRIIGRDTILPGKATQGVPVYCVEHGRWTGRKATFESAGALAHMELRKRAKFEDQGEVWKEVATKNAARGTENDSDTYRQVAQGDKVGKSVGAYQKHFSAALARVPSRATMVGYVVALNGKVVAIESFSSPVLFGKLEGKLLRSYFVEALDQPKVAGAKPPPPKAAAEFAAKVRTARAKQQKTLDTKAAETLRYDDAEVSGTMVNDKSAPAAAEPAYDSAYLH